ncbi:acyl-CoA dehydrogenase [Actibacterium sp. XHP0104]|uniref:acyl-CoA dehydrogenase n=1 Tax=Actibacterium sp. XHP0104 TaxID=2984335 RepID=UPI0021E84EC8|nr:acyl-CoA dehydrogenase [Actibacterium sp. XHP0104]MCV2882995.1 acyl-CoA dehydrogenase [Actibacterium sp. XHP0104]
MIYHPPVKDILFNIEHLSQWSEVCSAPCYSDIGTEDARAALEEFGRFCSEVIAPLAITGDETSSKLVDGKVVMPDGYEAAYAQFVEMGWQSLSHSPEFGGMGLPRAVGAAATEMMNAADMSFGLCPLLTDGAIEALSMKGSDEQKALYLDKMVTGEWTGTMNLTEPQAGSDLGRVRTKAVRQDDGSYAITGTKIFITYGDHPMSQNVIHLVLARTPGAPEGPKGLSLFVVPKFLVAEDGEPGKRNAVSCVSLEHKLGVRASPTAVLEFDGAKGFLVGEENKGLGYMFVMMSAARFSVGVQGVAVAERAYQLALSQAQERVQSRPVDGSVNDAVAIIAHPDVRRMLMRMRALVEGGRALVAATAGWLDLAHNGPEEARADADAMAELLVPLVKGHCTEQAVQVASHCIQVHGGMGFIEETGVARLYRDARILPIYEGTTAIQANDLLGRKVLRDGGETARRFADMIADTEQKLRGAGKTATAVAARLHEAREDFEASLEYLLETAPTNPNAAYAGSVPFLLLSGNLAAGWQLGRALLAAQEALERGEDTQFMRDKIATALFYAHHILPDCTAERTRITLGAASLMAAEI